MRVIHPRRGRAAAPPSRELPRRDASGVIKLWSMCASAQWQCVRAPQREFQTSESSLRGLRSVDVEKYGCVASYEVVCLAHAVATSTRVP